MNALRHRSAVAAAVAAALLVAGCGSNPSGAQSSTNPPVDSSTPGGATGSGASEVSTSPSSPGASAPSAGPSQASGSSVGPVASGSVTLVTHDSFNPDKKVLEAFEASSGIKITLLAQGDAGSLVNKLVLTKDNPLGDVVYGIDNTFASRAADAGVLQPYTSPLAGNGSDKFALPGDHVLTPIDYGDVCVNVDHKYFADKRLTEPKTYEDLAKPEYKNLLVVESPATSSPGLAFLLGTIDHFGDTGWQDYWKSLQANGVKVTSGWEDAYSVDFSGSTGKGSRPLVVSYASSPPYEVKDGMTTAPTGALLDTCFRQVEYAGVLTGAKNPAAAQAVVNFLLSPQFQAGLAENMYVYPVDTGVKLPESWTKYAPVAEHPATMDPAKISANRQQWLADWSDIVEG